MYRHAKYVRHQIYPESSPYILRRHVNFVVFKYYLLLYSIAMLSLSSVHVSAFILGVCVTQQKMRCNAQNNLFWQ